MIPEVLKPHFQKIDRCPLCRLQAIRDFAKLNGLNFSECKQCHFRFMNPSLSDQGMGLLYENSETLSKANPALGHYYEYQVGIGDNVTRRDYLNVLELGEKCLRRLSASSKLKLFEVGYGTGFFLLEAAHKGWEVDGIDTSESNCQMLVQERGLTVRHGTFQDFDPPKNHYHVVALWDVIEHTSDPGSFIQKAYDMLMPGGLLVLATPNIQGLLNRVSEFLYWISFKKLKFAVGQLYVVEHVGYFCEKTLRKLIGDHGFIFKDKFLTATDLARYDFSPLLKFCLKIFFAFARRVKMQNRIILMAEKPKN